MSQKKLWLVQDLSDFFVTQIRVDLIIELHEGNHMAAVFNHNVFLVISSLVLGW